MCTLKKIYYAISVPYKHMCIVNVSHSVPRQQICSHMGEGVFLKKIILQECKSNRNFYSGENLK